MIFKKKAISSSIIVMLAFSFVLSILLFTILNFTLSDRHVFCEDITLSASPSCESRNEKIILNLRNNGEKNLYYEINDILDSESQILLSDSGEEVKVDKESTYKLVPYVKGEDDQLYACISQTTYLSVSDIPKC